MRWNRGGHHRRDTQHQADGAEHDRIIQIADRPLRYNFVEAHAQCETSEEARDDGQDRRLHRSVYDVPATGTERHTDAKFLEPARHRVRHDTVKPDDCERQSKHGEAEQQQRHEPLTGPTRACQLVFRCAYPVHWLIWIDGTHRLPNRSGHRTGIVTRSQDHIQGIAQHERVRHVDRRRRRLMETDIGCVSTTGSQTASDSDSQDEVTANMRERKRITQTD